VHEGLDGEKDVSSMAENSNGGVMHGDTSTRDSPKSKLMNQGPE